MASFLYRHTLGRMQGLRARASRGWYNDWLHIWVQNLNEDRGGHVKGSPFWNHRGSISFKKLVAPWRRNWHQGEVGFSWQWVVPCRHPGFEFTKDNDDEDFRVHLGLWPLFDLFLGFHGLLKPMPKGASRERMKHPRWYEMRVYDDRSLQVRFFDKAIWWHLWAPDDDMWSQTSRWRRGSWHPVRQLLGRDDYHTRTLEVKRAEIPLPEGPYKAVFRFYEATWRYRRWPRWPLTRRIMRCDVTPDHPLPHPGKGEDSWNMDEDATYSSTISAQTLPEAIGRVVQHNMRDRLNYGGRDWRPERGPYGVKQP